MIRDCQLHLEDCLKNFNVKLPSDTKMFYTSTASAASGKCHIWDEYCQICPYSLSACLYAANAFAPDEGNPPSFHWLSTNSTKLPECLIVFLSEDLLCCKRLECITQGVSHTVYYTECIIQGVLYTVYYTGWIIHCVLYRVYHTLCIIQGGGGGRL